MTVSVGVFDWHTYTYPFTNSIIDPKIFKGLQ